MHLPISLFKHKRININIQRKLSGNSSRTLQKSHSRVPDVKYHIPSLHPYFIRSPQKRSPRVAPPLQKKIARGSQDACRESSTTPSQTIQPSQRETKQAGLLKYLCRVNIGPTSDDDVAVFVRLCSYVYSPSSYYINILHILR